MRIYAIGDIHGELGKLESLFSKLLPILQPEDRIVFIGDYIDRGPDSKGVVDRMLRFREERPSTIFLRGNHEQMIMEARAYYDMDYRGVKRPDDADQGTLWFSNGHIATFKSYGIEKRPQRWFQSIPDEHWRFFLSTKMEFTEGTYTFVHAGFVPPGEVWLEEGFDPRLWIREPFLSHPSFIGGKVVVFGHTPMKSGRPMVMRNKVGIDTAAAFGGPLTAVILDPNDIYDPVNLRTLTS